MEVVAEVSSNIPSRTARNLCNEEQLPFIYSTANRVSMASVTEMPVCWDKAGLQRGECMLKWLTEIFGA